MRRHVLIVCTVLSSAIVGGCDGAGKPDLERRTTTQITSATDSQARRAVNQALKEANPRAPRAAIILLWRRMQQGVVPLASTLYAQRVIDGLGLAAVQGGLLAQTSFFNGYAPRIIASEPTSLGVLLNVVAAAPGHQPVNATYLLVREDARWRITFDTVLEQGLDAYGRRAAQQSPDAERRKMAEAEGAALAERYRLLARGSSESTESG